MLDGIVIQAKSTEKVFSLRSPSTGVTSSENGDSERCFCRATAMDRANVVVRLREWIVESEQLRMFKSER